MNTNDTISIPENDISPKLRGGNSNSHPSNSHPFIPGIAVFLVILLSGMSANESAAQDFEEWMRQEQQQYESFRAEQNSAFADMLRQQWEAMQGDDPDSQLEEDKPVTLPVAEPVDDEPEPPRDTDPDIRDDVPSPAPPTPPSPPTPPEPAEETRPDQRSVPESRFTPPDPDPSQPRVSVMYYGLPLEVPYDSRIPDITIPDSYNAQNITAFWEKMSETDIESTVAFYSGIQEMSGINDWGLARLMFSVGESLFDGDRNQARLYTWFMLIQSGYKARVGFNDGGVRLMVASESHIYGTPFFRFDDVPYFLAHFDKVPGAQERLYTYASDFPGDLKPLSLQVAAIPILENNFTTRNLTFEFKGETFELDVEVDQNQIAFYEYFPQTELDVYFNAAVTQLTADGLITELESHLEGRSEKESVHLLLRFVQTAFGYKIDPDNFGREKPLFPEETIFYDYSDCEDRAILFSFLVRELTGLDVVGLRYPGHIATAVRFNEPVTGDVVDVNGDTYHVCDPTYINAGPGMAMDRYKNTIPKIIKTGR